MFITFVLEDRPTFNRVPSYQIVTFIAVLLFLENDIYCGGYRGKVGRDSEEVRQRVTVREKQEVLDLIGYPLYTSCSTNIRVFPMPEKGFSGRVCH